MPRHRLFAVLSLLLVRSGLAQGCGPELLSGSEGCGTDGTVVAQIVYDDGTGPSLIAGGGFAHAGEHPAANVARFDGVRWHPMGAGLNGPVRAFAVFDDGGGPALYAGGDFTASGGAARLRIARWSPATQTWNDVGGGFGGVDCRLRALEVHDFGGGPRLVAGGTFTTAGGALAASVAQWDGAAWAPVGAGIAGDVYDLHTWQGPGAAPPQLIASGTYPAPLNGVVRWAGTTWATLGLGLTTPTGAGRGHVLATYDDGSGARLFVGGVFQTATDAFGAATLCRNVAGWDGAAWTPLPGAFAGVVGPGAAPPGTIGVASPAVRALAVFDSGAGDELWVGGDFGGAGGAPDTVNLARFGPSGWTSAGSAQGQVHALLAADLGAGPRLYAAGDFPRVAQEPVRRVAAWNGAAWSRLGTGLPQRVNVLKRLDLGGGPQLYAATFPNGGLERAGVYRKDAGGWTRLGQSFDSFVTDLATYDSGSGPELYVAGQFQLADGAPITSVARWNGVAWQATTNGPQFVRALHVFDDGAGPRLYALGAFASAGGLRSLGKFDGTGWTPVGGSVTPSSGNVADAFDFAVFDAGSGPWLWAVGHFMTVGPNPSWGIGAWTGTSWIPVGSATSANPNMQGASCVVYDPRDGGGERLYVAGYFMTFPGIASAPVASTDGATWRSEGHPGLFATQLVAHDDGAGRALYASAGGLNVPCVRKLYGGAWSTVASTIAMQPPTAGSIAVECLESDPAGPTLWIGGGATVLDGVTSPFLRRYERSAPFDLALTQPFGSLSFGVDVGCGPAGAPLLTALSFDAANATAPGAGPWLGLHLATADLIGQIASGAPPFIGVLDASGASTFAYAPLPPWLAGWTVYGIAVAFGATLLPVADSGVAALTLQ
ncbi:MAG TPA: hypothetical protein VEI02_10290 [Planctomycetota bacterium]|nr:hypothetical protein [Planctomycetota bacterium]